MIAFVRYWLPLLVCSMVIFGASADSQSVERTSRFLVPFLRWFAPDVSMETVRVVRFIVRKSAHMIEFGVFAWLWWRALRRPVRNDPRPWSSKTAWMAMGATFLYALTDEFHQLFVSNRGGSLVDVGFDTVGGAIALGLIWLWYTRFRKAHENEETA